MLDTVCVQCLTAITRYIFFKYYMTLSFVQKIKAPYYIDQTEPPFFENVEPRLIEKFEPRFLEIMMLYDLGNFL